MKNNKEISWNDLINAAKAAAQGERIISPFMRGGYVSTALLTDKGNIYTAVNLESKCALHMCSERLAVYKVFEANKNEKIIRCVCQYRGSISLPCGACCEFFMQYGCDEMEILLDSKTLKTVKLKDTMPLPLNWWGKDYLDKH